MAAAGDMTFCFSDLLRHLIDAEELDLDLPALQEVSKIASISMHANGSDDDVSGRDGPAVLGLSKTALCIDMDRYKNIPPQVTCTSENVYMCRLR